MSEIYDRIAFAGVGRYNEFDSLRRAGVQHADIKGYQFSREDVDARSLANLYAQYMGNVFTHEMKPLEVEILVAEVGAVAGGGSAVPHPLRRARSSTRTATRVLGGEAEAIAARLAEAPSRPTGTSATPSAPPLAALAGPDRTPVAADLEVAVLARSNGPARLPPHRGLVETAEPGWPRTRRPPHASGAPARRRAGAADGSGPEPRRPTD